MFDNCVYKWDSMINDGASDEYSFVVPHVDNLYQVVCPNDGYQCHVINYNFDTGKVIWRKKFDVTTNKDEKSTIYSSTP